MCLIVTGNPFALKGDPFATSILENLMQRRPGGRVINETLNKATYLRRQKTSRHDNGQPLMLNYNFFPSTVRDVVAMPEELNRRKASQEERELFPDAPLKLESDSEGDDAEKADIIQAIEY